MWLNSPNRSRRKKPSKICVRVYCSTRRRRRRPMFIRDLKAPDYFIWIYRHLRKLVCLRIAVLRAYIANTKRNIMSYANHMRIKICTFVYFVDAHDVVFFFLYFCVD